MADQRIEKFARILVDHSTRVQPGDRVAITTTLAGVECAREVYRMALERGGHPHVLIELPDQDELLFAHANDDQLDFLPLFHQMAFEQFEVLIKLRAETNTRAQTHIPPERAARRHKTMAQLIAAQMRRGADESLRWISTQFPTQAYAMEADMGFLEYQDFFYRACHADENTADSVAYWQNIERQQKRYVERIQGHDRVELKGPHVDLSLSIQGRKFKNSHGRHNLPDGEIYTGPVESSASGWVHYTYPAVYQGRVVEGIELTFEQGRVVKATAQKNQDFLLQMLESDAGACYIGEFAIGTNFEIDRFTRNILFDEKIGGSFHMALGAGYPETGSQNKSVIHWDMICDLRTDSDIRVDGELIYRNGNFTF